METISYPLRIPKKIIELAEMRSKKERVDKSTALKQLLYRGGEEYLLELYKKGEISISKAAELLDVSIYEMYNILARRNIKVGPDRELLEKSRKYAKGVV
jgi:predicted HTH domain antitoxin